MRLLRALAVLASAAFLQLAVAQPAAASCAQQTLADRAGRADVVVFGTVSGIRMTFAAASGVIQFHPERVLKGTLTRTVEVYLGPTHGGPVTSVDHQAAPPQRHTLYLRSLGDGTFETDACSGSHEGDPTAEEERLLGVGTRVAAVEDMPSSAPLVVGVLTIVLVAVLVTGFVVRRSARAT